MAFHKTIQMYIFDGNPNGRIMCELSNWNGRIYKISRNDISEFGQRPDAEHTGIYFLFGKDEQNNGTVYVGEAEKIFTRLKQHLSDKDYWNDCVAVISKDNLLNKAHVKYLENKFFLLAQNSGRASIINSTTPTPSSISEYDEAMLEEFISNAKLLVNTLGYKVFESVEDSKPSQTLFSISAARGARAQGIIVADGFAVLKGSIVAVTTVPSMPDSLLRLRETLYQKGVIDKNHQFTKDYIFTSPSLAAAIVMGRNANGRTEWKSADHKTLKELEELLNE